jgi:Flp pilus assembly protein TadD
MTCTRDACAAAVTLMDDGHFARAAGILYSALAADPCDEHAMRLYALALHRHGLLPQALSMAWQTVHRHPWSSLAQYAYAGLLQESGQSHQALRAVDEALRLDPGYADAWVLRGDIFQSMWGPATAEPNYTAALRLQPDDPLAMHNLAVSRLRWGLLTRAVRGLQVAGQLNSALAPLVVENVGLALARVLRMATASVVFVATALFVVIAANGDGMSTVVPRIAAAVLGAALAVPLVWIIRLRLGSLLTTVLRQHLLLGARIVFVAYTVLLGVVTAVVGPNPVFVVACSLLLPGIVVLTVIGWLVGA